ncbi:MAG TPA: hypothetical protein VF209_03845 [Patescibacteria group bacterium]
MPRKEKPSIPTTDSPGRLTVLRLIAKFLNVETEDLSHLLQKNPTPSEKKPRTPENKPAFGEESRYWGVYNVTTGLIIHTGESGHAEPLRLPVKFFDTIVEEVLVVVPVYKEGKKTFLLKKSPSGYKIEAHPVNIETDIVPHSAHDFISLQAIKAQFPEEERPFAED